MQDASPTAGTLPATPDSPAVNAVPTSTAERIESLDFIRGIAVMGILAANIVAFGQPTWAYFSPNFFMVEAGDPDGWMWLTQLVVIDGKMRGLFTLLFGAGMYMFMERAWQRGSSRWLQAWRLLILLGFGLIHFYLIWMGDILSGYALIGFIALAFMRLQARTQLRLGLLGYVLGSILMAGLMSFPHLFTETAFGEAEGLEEARSQMLEDQAKELVFVERFAELKQQGEYTTLIAERFEKEWFGPFAGPLFMIFETLPLMLIGMALYRMGFFSGGFDRGKMMRWGWIGIVAGAVTTAMIGLYVIGTGYAYNGAMAAFIGWTMLSRLLMTLGIAALLVVYSPGWSGWLAERVRAAGRAAFTNYLGTSILMLFVFHGWALGLFGELNRPQLYGVAALTWVIMLAWSKPWLERYRYGPLEWLWRCLTYRQIFPLRR